MLIYVKIDKFQTLPILKFNVGIKTLSYFEGCTSFDPAGLFFIVGNMGVTLQHVCQFS